MNDVTNEQVLAAFATAGQIPLAPAASIATVLSWQLAVTSLAFSQISFSVEPYSFIVQLRQDI